MHHDSIKNTCIARFDHRCSWLYCAIGLYNYPYFIKFCFYATLFGLFGIINHITAYCLGLFATKHERNFRILMFIICLIL